MQGKLPQLDGVLVLNKPNGPTSAACVGQIKRLGQKKIGHAGTLDPMAQGVLIILLGQGTKIAQHLLADGEKTYKAVARLGAATDTWDAEGKILTESSWTDVREQDIESIVTGWIGKQEQVVPPYSAAKHQGQPLHKLARLGMEVPVKIKTVEITQAEIVWCKLPDVCFRVTCSSGTYIRFLAHSLGTRLECGAHLIELTREYSHPFALTQAHSLESVLEKPEQLAEKVLSLAQALPHWLHVSLLQAEVTAIHYGKTIACTPSHFSGSESAVQDGTSAQKALLLDHDGALVALAEQALENNKPVWKILRGFGILTNS